MIHFEKGNHEISTFLQVWRDVRPIFSGKNQLRINGFGPVAQLFRPPQTLQADAFSRCVFLSGLNMFFLELGGIPCFMVPCSCGTRILIVFEAIADNPPLRHCWEEIWKQAEMSETHNFRVCLLWCPQGFSKSVQEIKECLTSWTICKFVESCKPIKNAPKRVSRSSTEQSLWNLWNNWHSGADNLHVFRVSVCFLLSGLPSIMCCLLTDVSVL